MGVLAERGLYQTFSSSDKQKDGRILYRAIGSNGSMICGFADSMPSRDSLGNAAGVIPQQ
jgi:hypothetical protein